MVVAKFKRYSATVNDVFITPGNTAVFKCTVNPYYVREYVTVTQWKTNQRVITSGRHLLSCYTGAICEIGTGTGHSFPMGNPRYRGGLWSTSSIKLNSDQL